MTTKLTAAPPRDAAHEIFELVPRPFGDGGRSGGAGDDRAVCPCGWINAPARMISEALVALYVSRELVSRSTTAPSPLETSL